MHVCLSNTSASRWQRHATVDGNVFGGGYAANSDVDIANITLWDGIIRNSMYGGGEIATIGRGTQAKDSSTNEFDVTIYKPGETHVTMWGGHVIRDVFGGGRGFNNWKTEDKTEGNTNGYVFGKTDVNIHLGIIGTPEGLEKGYGNVFGGGNQADVTGKTNVRIGKEN